MRSRIKTWSFPLLLSQHFLKKQKKKRFAFPPAFCGMWFCENGFADLLALCAKVASPPPRRGSNGFSIWSVIKSRSWNKRYQVTGWPPRRFSCILGTDLKERSGVRGAVGLIPSAHIHPGCPRGAASAHLAFPPCQATVNGRTYSSIQTTASPRSFPFSTLDFCIQGANWERII